MVSVNQRGVRLGMKAAALVVRLAGGGTIVNISSLFGIIGSPGSIAYYATKGTVRTISKTAALEYDRQGIRVNSIHPGMINTSILGNLTMLGEAAIRAAIPMGRMGKPEDIEYNFLYLCSNEAAYVTGIELVIDGGWLAQ